MKVRPCVCFIRSFGPPNEWYLKSVRLNGADVTDAGVEFKSDQEAAGFEFTMTNHPTFLSGLVYDRKDQASHEYTLILFARDRDRWNPGSRYLATTRPDQGGRYQLRGIPAGSYYAIAVDYVEQGEWTDPEYLEKIKGSAATVSIGDGETKTLDLKLATGGS